MSEERHSDAALVLLDSTKLVGELSNEVREMISRLQQIEARVMYEIVDGTVHDDDVDAFNDARVRQTGLAAHRINADAYLAEVATSAAAAKEALAELKRTLMSGFVTSRVSVANTSKTDLKR